MNDRPPILAGLALVAVGALLLLDELGHLDAAELLATWWPVLVIAAGLVNLTIPPRSIGGGLLLTVGGSVLLLWRLDVVDDLALLWPALLLTVGLWLLLGRGARSRTATAHGHSSPPQRAWWTERSPDRAELVGDRVDVVTIFADRTLRADPGTVRGGQIVTVFGDVDLDLHATSLAGEAVLSGVTIFGDVDVLVPAAWRVRSGGGTVFGSVRIEPPTVPADGIEGHELRLDLVTIFGDVEVHRAAPPPTMPVDETVRQEEVTT